MSICQSKNKHSLPGPPHSVMIYATKWSPYEMQHLLVQEPRIKSPQNPVRHTNTAQANPGDVGWGPREAWGGKKASQVCRIAPSIKGSPHCVCEICLVLFSCQSPHFCHSSACIEQCYAPGEDLHYYISPLVRGFEWAKIYFSFVNVNTSGYAAMNNTIALS